MANDGSMGLRFRKASDTILESYECSLREGSRPIAFAENETHLERLGFETLKSPPDFRRDVVAKPAIGSGRGSLRVCRVQSSIGVAVIDGAHDQRTFEGNRVSTGTPGDAPRG